MNSLKSYNEEEKAESVDSGCFSDIIGSSEINWDQVSSALQYEYNFSLGLLQHTTKVELLFTEPENQEAKQAASGEENNGITTDSKNKLTEGERRELEHELARLKKGKTSILSYKKAKLREKKIRRQLKIIDNGKSKSLKKEKKEAKALEFQSEAAKKIYNNSGKLVYSKFDFSYANKEKWTDNLKLDLNHCMNKVLKEKEEINSLQNKGKIDKAAEVMETKIWDRAFAKANGEKVKDNAQKLNKSIDRRKTKKTQSQKKWKEREQLVKKFQDKSRDKKSQNVISRKEKQNAFRSKKKKGKKSRVPGF